MKKLIKTIGKSIFKICGCLIMLLIIFYLNFYSKAYTPTSLGRRWKKNKNTEYILKNNNKKNKIIYNKHT